MLKIELTDLVDFYSPGTIVSECSQRPCKYGDIAGALEFARGVKERHGATPYGFRFLRRRDEVVIDSDGNRAVKATKEIDLSGIHFITGTVRFYDDVPDDQEHRICRGNMLGNDMPFVVENKNSYTSTLPTLPFGEKDVVVSLRGEIVERGDSPERMERRKEFKKRQEEYYKSR
jgi:hypothetical protein